MAEAQMKKVHAHRAQQTDYPVTTATTGAVASAAAGGSFVSLLQSAPVALVLSLAAAAVVFLVMWLSLKTRNR